MSILTPFFNLFKYQKTDKYDIKQFNDNMDIIDGELHKPPLTVNGKTPDPISRDLLLTTVPLADNLTSDEAQINIGEYIIRSSGGEASIEDGSAMLSEIRGNQVKTGYVQEVIDATVSNDDLSISVDRAVFVAYVQESGTITLNFTTAWNVDPATYGITVSGTPQNGDTITIVYVKENRGQITTATPTSFVSTGWNLYNHVTGYARVVNYSDEYGFMIDGTYSAIAFAETLNGQQTPITPVNGYFTLPAGAESGYVFVTGGNDTDTMLWMAWGDWTEQPNGGTFEPYSQTVVDLSGVMVSFPDGLMRVGNAYDEINLNTGRAYSRIEKLQYNAENLENVIASGVPYDTDTGYIYAVRLVPAVYSVSLEGGYTVSDHGEEMFIGTAVPLTAASLYGQDLKGKLRRNVLTISQQTLTDQQKAQVLQNIGAASVDVEEIVSAFCANAWGKGQHTLNGKWSCAGVISGGSKDLYIYYPVTMYGVSAVSDLVVTNVTVRGVSGYILHDDSPASGDYKVSAIQFIGQTGFRIQLSKVSGAFNVTNNTPITSNIDGTLVLS